MLWPPRSLYLNGHLTDVLTLSIICLFTWYFFQVNNLSVNILPVAYTPQSHGQSSYSTDDLPKTVVMTLNQGSAVKSMDFHPVQQILLVGKTPLAWWTLFSQFLLLALLFTSISFWMVGLTILSPFSWFNHFSWDKHGWCYVVGGW